MRAKHGLILFAILSLIVVGFIFHNSLQESEESHERSDVIVEMVEPVVETILEPEEPEEEVRKSISFAVRKAAHFIEFSALGICAGGFFGILSMDRKRRYRGWAFLFCVAVACCDETIQSFTGRTNSLKDVALDSVGSLFGILLILAVFRFFKRKRGGETPCPN